MTDDALMPILQRIQADLATVKQQGEEVKTRLTAIERRFSRDFDIVKQDVRMIRSAIHDMGETRVTEGEIAVLHEDVNRVQTRLSDLETRLEELEGRRQ